MYAFVPTPHLPPTLPHRAARLAPRTTPHSSARTRPSHPLLVFVTPSGICNEPSRALALSEAALNGGAAHVQLRDRHASDEALSGTLRILLSRLDPTKLIVNGNIGLELAKEYPGVGVHVREADTRQQLSAALRIAHPTAQVGCSVHSVRAALSALKHGTPHYMQVGTMYTTGTHPGQRPQGPSLMRAIRDAVGDDCTLIGVGGIDKVNAVEVLQHGGDGVAVITAISKAKDAKRATANIIEATRTCFRGKRL